MRSSVGASPAGASSVGPVNSDWDRIADLHDLVEGLAVEFEILTKAAGLPPASPS
jgi:hypothetical protein